MLWNVLLVDQGFGSFAFSFRSCVRCVPDSEQVIVVGPDGCDISHDEGKTWNPFGDQGFHIFSVGIGAIWAAGSEGANRAAQVISSTYCNSTRKRP